MTYTWFVLELRIFQEKNAKPLYTALSSVLASSAVET